MESTQRLTGTQRLTEEGGQIEGRSANVRGAALPWEVSCWLMVRSLSPLHSPTIPPSHHPTIMLSSTVQLSHCYHEIALQQQQEQQRTLAEVVRASWCVVVCVPAGSPRLYVDQLASIHPLSCPLDAQQAAVTTYRSAVFISM